MDLVLLFFMVNFSKNEATCRTEKTTWGSAVMNHTYKTLNASNFVSCVLKSVTKNLSAEAATSGGINLNVN